ncbi:hypothetical protein VPG91_11715 [Nitrospirillum amazonense]|uniref:hypothetical protein n=1 Tax=Nitrospirillum amazonense TaxID=28077 RepID=UPI002DD4308A|nr:hypothetical protein [Nitrospirillum amazonense]MEC4591657.1 hypothetical protein [Nitrospirillum amazonense]
MTSHYPEFPHTADGGTPGVCRCGHAWPCPEFRPPPITDGIAPLTEAAIAEVAVRLDCNTLPDVVGARRLLATIADLSRRKNQYAKQIGDILNRDGGEKIMLARQRDAARADADRLAAVMRTLVEKWESDEWVTAQDEMATLARNALTLHAAQPAPEPSAPAREAGV